MMIALGGELTYDDVKTVLTSAAAGAAKGRGDAWASKKLKIHIFFAL